MFTESKVLTAGKEQTVFETKYGKIGVGICYDMRFPELCMTAARKGAIAMLYPGAFNQVTGPLHVYPRFNASGNYYSVLGQ